VGRLPEGGFAGFSHEIAKVDVIEELRSLAQILAHCAGAKEGLLCIWLSA